MKTCCRLQKCCLGSGHRPPGLRWWPGWHTRTASSSNTGHRPSPWKKEASECRRWFKRRCYWMSSLLWYWDNVVIECRRWSKRRCYWMSSLLWYLSPGKNGLWHDDLPHMVTHGVQAQSGLSDDVTECRHYFGICHLVKMDLDMMTFHTWWPMVFRHSQAPVHITKKLNNE